jgi:hypothetical protein
MMEVTLTEVVLFAWAMLATSRAISCAEEARMSKEILRTMFIDKEVRVRMLNDFDTKQEKINASES